MRRPSANETRLPRGVTTSFIAVKESVQKIPGRGIPDLVAASVTPDGTAGSWTRMSGRSHRRSVPPSIGPARLHRVMPSLRRARRYRLHAGAFDLLEGVATGALPARALRLRLFHPYMDGNGRMGRFLMNAMLASGGYPWTIVPVDRCDDYMRTLESASVKLEIKPFAEFVGRLVQDRLDSKPLPKVPAK